MKKLMTTTVAIAALLSVSSPMVLAQGATSAGDGVVHNSGSYSPYTNQNYPNQVLWGDTHVHTNLSLDARTVGVILSPEDAFRFGRGEEVTASGGYRVRLGRPLDFLVVTDHSDAMGAMDQVIAGNPALLSDPLVQDWHNRIGQGAEEALNTAQEIINNLAAGTLPAVMTDEAFVSQVWNGVIAAADAYNDPGRFTAFIGYEWTSMPEGNNLHRNVIYRDGANLAGQVLPLTTASGEAPENLWNWLEEYEALTGGQILAIAHNGNVSNGLMFSDNNYASGEPFDRAYAETRARWEPIYEVTQIKGDGETHAMLSPNDEFADYETWDRNNLGPLAKEDWMIEWEYARQALRNGLRHEENLGANPFQFGLIGSTDAHTGLATAEEDNFFGKLASSEPSAQRMSLDVAHFGGISWPGWYQASSGYAAVWARENTRGAIFDAMMRRETYATTGPRMTVRFFGGWDFEDADANTRQPARVGYSRGVPMGGELTNAPQGVSPRFLVAANRDPNSGNLDRIQIIKGWLDDGGETHEQVYNVAWSEHGRPSLNRRQSRTGDIEPIESTVDVATATWTNTVGDPELIAVWEDPDFDPNQRAFYYARVIEIWTPRWTAYEAAYYGIEAPVESPMTTQERAYTSPIWYTPG